MYEVDLDREATFMIRHSEPRAGLETLLLRAPEVRLNSELKYDFKERLAEEPRVADSVRQASFEK